jgi:hypothetical protein
MGRGGLLTLVGALVAATNAPGDAKSDVKDAAKKLGGGSYSWVATSKNNADGGGQGNRFQPGPTEGKADKEGTLWITVKFGDNSAEAILKGQKGALKAGDEWKALSEVAPPGGAQQGQRDPSVFLARGLRNFKSPAAQIEAMIDKMAELKDDGSGALAGDLSEDGVKELVVRGGRPGGNAPQISEAKGSAKFWLKDGLIAKAEWTVSGKMTFGQQEREFNRTTTVEIKDVGSTKFEVPEEARKKLE